MVNMRKYNKDMEINEETNHPEETALKGNIVIPPPWINNDGILVEWIPWDEI